MDLDWFKDLASLAETGNFTRAAERRHVSQSAFSRRIKALEAWVGTPLVDRSSQPVTITDAGRQILEAAEQAVARLETERAQIRESLEQPDTYVVTFGAQHSIGWRFFPAWLQELEQTHGPIISRLRADDLPNCIDDLTGGEIDFVIAYESDQAKEPSVAAFESLRIGRDRLMPVCKRTSDGTPLFPIGDDASSAIPYLRFGPTAPIARHIDPTIDAQNLRGRLTPVYENSMAGALRIRARDGLGVAWLPKSLIAPDLESGSLTTAGGDRFSIDVDILLYCQKSNHNRIVRSLWDFLSERNGVPLI